MKTKGRRQSTNVEVGAPFTQAQLIGMRQVAPGQPMPGIAPRHPVKTPFDVLNEQITQMNAAEALGLGDVRAKMEGAIRRDEMRGKMQARTRWGNEWKANQKGSR